MILLMFVSVGSLIVRFPSAARERESEREREKEREREGEAPQGEKMHLPKGKAGPPQLPMFSDPQEAHADE